MNYKQSVIYIFCCIYLFIGWLFFSASVFAEEISVLTKNASISYSIEIADTPELRQQGLMYRKNMPPNQGMLFVFEKIKPVSMWMKNTYIPLDMLFLDEKGIIRYIYENARPLDETIITCPIPIKYVIELNAGQIQEKQIQLLDQVILN